MNVTYANLKATTAAVLLRAAVTTVMIRITVSVGQYWGGYAYDYFAEDYTVTP